MKMRNLIFGFLILTLAGTFVFLINSENNAERKYTPRQSVERQTAGYKGAAQWMHERRANQFTGIVDIKDVKKAKNQISKLRNKRGSLGLTWHHRGPNNIGGRSRAIVFDKNNPKVIYAAGVSGGLWKSETNGTSWTQIKYEGDQETGGIPNLAIASMCQAANGDIYFGTGEGHYKPYNPGTATRGIQGAGIWKSTDGDNFTRLSSTWNDSVDNTFNYVNKLAADPNNANRIFAATNRGIRLTEDGGQTWSNPILNIAGTPMNIFAGDVKIGSNGNVVIADIDGSAYVSNEGGKEGSWKEVSGTADSLITNNGARLEFGIAPSDPNYIYCQASNNAGALINIYRSTDAGNTWEIIGPGGSSTFNPLGEQGTFDNVIAVFPDNKNEIIVGGQLNVWKWEEGGNWQIVSFHYLSKTSTNYVHADQHEIKFKPNNPDIVYLGTDGGVHRSLDRGQTWETMNKYFNVTQFYAINYGPNNELIGGTQDNGSLLYDPNKEITTGTDYPYSEVSGGDGGYCAISQLNSNILFSTVYYGSLYRSEEKGKPGTVAPFYNGRLSSAVNPGDQGSGNNFVTPMALWESYNDEHTRDTVYYPAPEPILPNDTIKVESETVSERYITHVTKKAYHKDSLIPVADHFQAILAVGFNGSVWATREPLNFKADPAPWVPVADTVGKIEVLEWSKDGNHLYFANTNGTLYRTTGFHNAYGDSLMDAESEYYKLTTTKIAKFSGRKITGLAVDPNDANNVAVTLGQFGNNDYIYMSNSAATSGEHNDEGTFTSKQGDNLPKMPLYDAVIVWNDNKKVIVGSEYGLFATADISASSPEWHDENNGADYVAVYDLEQQDFPNGWNSEIGQPTEVSNHGYIYAGTHGRGIFQCDDFKGPVGIEPDEKENTDITNKLEIYPNPATNYVNLKFTLDKSENVNVKIFDMQGKLVISKNFDNLNKGNQTKKININKLKRGTYITKLSGKNLNKVSRIIVK